MTNKVEKLAEEVATGQKCSFTDDEMEALRGIAQFWIGMQVVGRVATAVQRVAMWVGWMVAAYLAMKAGAADWVKAVIVGGAVK